MSRRICIFAGASEGADPVYVRAARALGHELGRAQIDEISSGGTNGGLMGICMIAAQSYGVPALGITLADRWPEMDHANARLERAVDLASRKAQMIAGADACIALPGGYGTLDELFTLLAGVNLGYYRQPIALFDVMNPQTGRFYFDRLVAFLEHARAEGFIGAEAPWLIHHSDPRVLLEHLWATLDAQAQAERVPVEEAAQRP